MGEPPVGLGPTREKLRRLLGEPTNTSVPTRNRSTVDIRRRLSTTKGTKIRNNTRELRVCSRRAPGVRFSDLRLPFVVVVLFVVSPAFLDRRS